MRRLPAGRLDSGFALGLCVALTALLAGHPVFAGSGFDEAYRLYRKAETRLDSGAHEEALALIDRAIERSGESGTFRVGIQQRNYYPHFLRGLIQLRLGNAEAAREDFTTELAKSEIQKDAGLHARLRSALQEAEAVDTEAPVVRLENVEIADFLTVERDGREVEQVRVRLRGFAIDPRSGIRSLSVGDHEMALISTDDDQRFDDLVTVDANTTTIEIVAVDGSGNVGKTEHLLQIPALHLGSAAERIHAVVVGVNEYDKSYRTELGDCRNEVRSSCGPDEAFTCYSIPDLSHAADDAENFADLLMRRGVPPENVQLLTSKDGDMRATRESVLKALERLERTEGDRAIFYFSGHGVSSKRQQNLMLMSDTQGWECGRRSLWDESTVVEESALGVRAVAQALMRSPIKQRYLILDACRSPRMGTKGPHAQQPAPGFSLAGTKGLGLVTVTEPEDRGLEPVIFYSTLERKVSVEWNRMSSGYFTYFLLQGLRRDLPLDQLKRYVQRNVKEQTTRDLCSTDPAGADCPFVQAPHLQLPDQLENDYELQSRTFILGRSIE